MRKVEYLITAAVFLLGPPVIELFIQVKKKNKFGIKFLIVFILLGLSLAIWGYSKLK